MFLNKKVLIVIFLTILVLIGLSVYTFGSYSNTKKILNTSHSAPVSPVASNKKVVNNTNVTFATFQNKDVQGDYYSVSFPNTWQISKGTKAGEYTAQFSGGDGQVELLEVPDNTTLELLVLSQEEPQLKKTVSGYKRVDYKKITIQGNDSYQLTYTSTATDGLINQTVKTYVSGSDMASVITLTAPQTQFTSQQPVFLSVIGSFAWNNK